MRAPWVPHVLNANVWRDNLDYVVTNCVQCNNVVDFGTVSCALCSYLFEDEYWDCVSLLHEDLIVDPTSKVVGLSHDSRDESPLEALMLCCNLIKSHCTCSRPVSENSIFEYLADPTWEPYSEESLCKSCALAYTVDCPGLRDYVFLSERATLTAAGVSPRSHIIDTCNQYDYDGTSVVAQTVEGPSLFD